MTELLDEMELTLRRPLATAYGEATVLKLREPTAGEMDKFAKAAVRDGQVQAALTLIALVAGVDRPFLEKLGARDFTAASAYLAAFMDASPADGATPSPT